LSTGKIEEDGFIRVPQLLHSAQLTLCGFFLFDHLKLQLEWKPFFDDSSVTEEGGRILTEI
jgi:hypothetical protein